MKVTPIKNATLTGIVACCDSSLGTLLIPLKLPYGTSCPVVSVAFPSAVSLAVIALSHLLMTMR